MSHMEVHKSSPQAESIQPMLSGLPPEPYHVPRGQTIHAEYHSKGDHGTTYTTRNYIHDGSPR